MQLEEYDNYDTVRIIGDVILVGESHRSKYSLQLMREILDIVEPTTVAVEAISIGTNGGTGIGVAARAYRSGDAECIAAIDDGFCGVDVPEQPYSGGIMTVANEFTFDIQPNGDMNPKSREDARQNVYNRYGSMAHRMMYDIRELLMAQRLRWLSRRGYGPIVAAVGAFHLDKLEEYYRAGDREVEPIEMEGHEI